MDFQLDEDSRALAELAAKILADQATPERVKAVESEAAAGADGVDHKLWADLAGAGLVAATLSEDNGGAGLGMVGAGAVLFEIGRRVAPVPYLETAVGSLAIEHYGAEELRTAVLEPAATGSLVLSLALTEAQGDPRVPSTSAVASDVGSLVLTGEKLCVPFGLAAGGFLVPASLADGSSCVVYVASDAEGLSVARQDTAAGRPQARLTLNEVCVPAGHVLGSLGGEQGAVLGWLVEHATAAMCVHLAGVLEEALQITVGYVKERKQFERVLASFQAVGQRAADSFIDTAGVRLTAWQAVWRLSAGLPATDEVAIAKFWAADAGQRVVHACQHLHGGVGMDRDYPIHRYFLVAKETNLLLGGAAAQLAGLGRRIAASV